MAVRVLLALREREKLYTVIHDRVVLVLVLGIRHSEPRIHHCVGVCSAELQKCIPGECTTCRIRRRHVFLHFFCGEIRSKMSCVRKTSKEVCTLNNNNTLPSPLVAIPCTPNAIQERSEHLIVVLRKAGGGGIPDFVGVKC